MGNSLLAILSISSMVFPDIAKLVSSANRTGINFVNISPRSFMYAKNNKGPKIDPCGTPHVISSVLDFDLLNVQYCFRSDK